MKPDTKKGTASYDALKNSFLKSSEFDTLSIPERKHAKQVLTNFGNLMKKGFSENLSEWNETNVTECMLYLVPGLLMQSEHPAEVFVPVTEAFFRFPETKTEIETADIIADKLSGLIDEVEKRSHFPVYWILEKKFQNDKEANIDPGTPPEDFKTQEDYERYLYQCLHLVNGNWGEKFAQSPEFENLRESDKKQFEHIIGSITDAALLYKKKRPQDWDAELIGWLISDLYPADAIEGYEFFDSLGNVLSEFFSFLQKNGFHKNGADMQKTVLELKDEAFTNSQNPEFWSDKKRMDMISSGALTDAELEKYGEQIQNLLNQKNKPDEENKNRVKKQLKPRGKKKKLR